MFNLGALNVLMDGVFLSAVIYVADASDVRLRRLFESVDHEYRATVAEFSGPKSDPSETGPHACTFNLIVVMVLLQTSGGEP